MPRTLQQVDSTLIKAIARAFRWRHMLETRPLRDDQGVNLGREDQSVLRQPRAASDVASAKHSGGDTRWTAASDDDTGGVDEAISSSLGEQCRPWPRQ
jgi:hypothetical protein